MSRQTEPQTLKQTVGMTDIVCGKAESINMKINH